MGVLSDREIMNLCEDHNLIDNPILKSRSGTISAGFSSYGYDIRLDKHFKIFTNIDNAIIDPKNFSKNIFRDVTKLQYLIIPPHTFVLGKSIEYLKIPRDILVICLGKSTYARCGIIVNVTPLEPEWEGYITIEISNTTSLPAKVYIGEGITQLIFLTANTVCDVSYADKKGKYQHQDQLTLPKV